VQSFGWLVALFVIFMVFGGAQTVLRLVEGRRKHLLEVKQEERLIAEAKVRELELEHKRRELEYREALLELERFDRRTGRPGPERQDPTEEAPDA
jgi:hypothetical protein